MSISCEKILSDIVTAVDQHIAKERTVILCRDWPMEREGMPNWNGFASRVEVPPRDYTNFFTDITGMILIPTTYGFMQNERASSAHFSLTLRLILLGKSHPNSSLKNLITQQRGSSNLLPPSRALNIGAARSIHQLGSNSLCQKSTVLEQGLAEVKCRPRGLAKHQGRSSRIESSLDNPYWRNKN